MNKYIVCVFILLISISHQQTCKICYNKFQECYKVLECREMHMKFKDCALQNCQIQSQNNWKDWSECYKNECREYSHPLYGEYDECVMEKCTKKQKI